MGTWTNCPRWPRWKLYINTKAWNSTYRSPSSNCCLWMPNLTATEINAEPLIWHCSSRIPICNQRVSWLQQAPFLEKIRDFFFSMRINIYSKCWLVFLVHRASVSTTIWRPTKCLVHRQGITHNIVSDQEVTVGTWPSDPLAISLTTPSQSRLVSLSTGITFSTANLKHHFRGNTWKEQGAIL